eukprot:gene9880-biopygen15284
MEQSGGGASGHPRAPARVLLFFQPEHVTLSIIPPDPPEGETATRASGPRPLLFLPARPATRGRAPPQWIQLGLAFKQETDENARKGEGGGGRAPRAAGYTVL